MKGSEKVIERLNEALLLELGAVNQYWLHYRMLDDWGLGKLAKKQLPCCNYLAMFDQTKPILDPQ